MGYKQLKLPSHQWLEHRSHNHQAQVRDSGIEPTGPALNIKEEDGDGIAGQQQVRDGIHGKNGHGHQCRNGSEEIHVRNGAKMVDLRKTQQECYGVTIMYRVNQQCQVKQGANAGAIAVESVTVV